MSEHDLEKLLGGFAADTLTPEERQKLFTAALQDQQLFNALADEQALKELLADPAVRRKLLHALNQTTERRRFLLLVGLVATTCNHRLRRRPRRGGLRHRTWHEGLSRQSPSSSAIGD